MNGRQCKKKLKDSLFHDYEVNGKKIYSYIVVHDNLITVAFTAKPKQKGSRSFPQKYILEELRLYGHKSAYELNVLF
jgi:hypothetical protein